LGKPAASLKVSVRALTRFWPAETYHQNYARRNGVRYRYYRWACRRDQRLDAVWGGQARRGERWRNAGQASAPASAAPTSGSAPATTAGNGTPPASPTLPPGGTATAIPGSSGAGPAVPPPPAAAAIALAS
jgi:hypothetical protein